MGSSTQSKPEHDSLLATAGQQVSLLARQISFNHASMCPAEVSLTSLFSGLICAFRPGGKEDYFFLFLFFFMLPAEIYDLCLNIKYHINHYPYFKSVCF